MISDLYFLKKTKSEIVGSFLYIFYLGVSQSLCKPPN